MKHIKWDDSEVRKDDWYFVYDQDDSDRMTGARVGRCEVQYCRDVWSIFLRCLWVFVSLSTESVVCGKYGGIRRIFSCWWVEINPE